MDDQDSPLLAAALLLRIGSDANSARIADAVHAIWKEVDAGLFSILGQRGVAALYQRCLYLTAKDFPWLHGAFEGVQGGMNLPALRAAMLQQTPTNAAAASRALLGTFEKFLINLVGPGITERLLQSAYKNSSGFAAQDTSS